MHLGIDLGGTKIEIVALDAQSNILHRQRIASPQGDYQQTLDAICGLVKHTETIVEGSNSLGIGIPGTPSPETGLIKNANSTWLIGRSLQHDLESKLERPIALANDADCFALSEATDGAAAGYRSVFGVILGTGVGGGLVIHSQLLAGPNAIAGEWGHNPLPWQTESDILTPCYCGKSGCIETFLSGPGMSRQYALKQTQPGIVSSQQIVALSRTGDRNAMAQIKTYIDQLARGLASVINIVDPDIIVLGGGLSNIDELYQRLPESILNYVFSDTCNTQIVKAVHGDSSGVRGAAWLGASVL